MFKSLFSFMSISPKISDNSSVTKSYRSLFLSVILSHCVIYSNLHKLIKALIIVDLYCHNNLVTSLPNICIFIP